MALSRLPVEPDHPVQQCVQHLSHPLTQDLEEGVGGVGDERQAGHRKETEHEVVVDSYFELVEVVNFDFEQEIEVEIDLEQEVVFEIEFEWEVVVNFDFELEVLFDSNFD